MNKKRKSDKQHKKVLFILLLILALAITACVILIIARVKLDRKTGSLVASPGANGSSGGGKQTDALLGGLLVVADADADYSNNVPLSGAQVNLKGGSVTDYEENVTVGEDGQYRFEHLAAGSYVLTVSKKGYLDVQQELVIREGQACYNNALIEMIDTIWSGSGTAAGELCDAANGKGLAGVSLEIRSGIGKTQGEAEAVITTDADGRYQTPSMQAGNYSVSYKIGEGNDAVSGIFQIKILGARSISGQNATVRRENGAGKMRIELYWGVWPLDMDSHLYCDMENGEFYHVYYWDKVFTSDGKPVAELKKDDYSSYGPEITQIDLSNAGLYTFAVFNYTGDEQENIAGSNARVYVYRDYDSAPAYAFCVPTEGDGGFWTVFSYDSAAGIMTQLDKIGYEHPVPIEGADERK